jgi:hypothetical protein
MKNPPKLDPDQLLASQVDDAFTALFDVLGNAHPEKPGVIVGGAVVAIVRFTIKKLFVAPAVPTVRDVFGHLIKPINVAAEQLLSAKPPLDG